VVDFVEEVDEQLRSDRYRALAPRLLPWVFAGLAALILGWLGVWAYKSWRDRNVAAASVTYEKALSELAGGDEAGAFNDLAGLAASGPPGYKTLALMMQGNVRLAHDKPAEAATFYDKAAAAAPTPVLQDLAKFRAAQALMDTPNLIEAQNRLMALTGAKKPFDLQAREALAITKLAMGKTAEARADFSSLSITLGAPQSMRGRAQSAMTLIDEGQAPAILAAAKAAAALPVGQAPPAGAGAPDGGQTDADPAP
jgi:hypothetical protein